MRFDIAQEKIPRCAGIEFRCVRLGSVKRETVRYDVDRRFQQNDVRIHRFENELANGAMRRMARRAVSGIERIDDRRILRGYHAANPIDQSGAATCFGAPGRGDVRAHIGEGPEREVRSENRRRAIHLSRPNDAEVVTATRWKKTDSALAAGHYQQGTTRAIRAARTDQRSDQGLIIGMCADPQNPLDRRTRRVNAKQCNQSDYGDGHRYEYEASWASVAIV